MKKIIALLVAAAIIIIIAGFSAGKNGSDKVIKIGGAFGLTDFVAEWGEAERNGATLAVEEANAGSDENRVKVSLVVESSGSNSAESVSAVTKLLTVDKVDAVVGPTWLDNFQGAAPLAEQYKKIMITPSSVISIVESEKNYPNVFSTWYPLDVEIETILSHLKKNGIRTLHLVIQNDPFFNEISSQIQDLAKSYSIEIVGNYKFNATASDYRTELSKVKQVKPDAIFFGMVDEKEQLSFLKQVAVLYPEARMYTTEAIEAFVEKPEYKDLLKNTEFVSPIIKDETFKSVYKKRFGIDPVFSASNSYDATKILIKALKSEATSTEEIRDYLLKTTFDTATFGSVGFDEKGGIKGGKFIIKKVVDNKAIEIF